MCLGDSLTDTLISHGVPGFSLHKHERVALLVEAVGGMTKAAEIADVATDTVNKWRKEGAKLPLDGMLALAVAAGVSLDWVATGYQIRPDIEARGVGVDDASAAGFRPLASHDSEGVAPFAANPAYLSERFGVSPEHVRYFEVTDPGQSPEIPIGALAFYDGRPVAHPRSGLHVVLVGGELLVRRINFLPDGSAELAADNIPTWRYPLVEPVPPIYKLLWTTEEA